MEEENNQEKKEDLENNFNYNILPPLQENEKEKFVVINKKEKKDILDALRIVCPGTPLREGIDDIVRSKKGALIVVESGDLTDIVEGGFKLNCKFTPQRLVELAKMDGALILSNDLKRILLSNALLIPNPKIPSDETGTRHKAAERTANQAKTLVIAISERKSTITIYYDNLKYSLKSTSEILNRALEKLQVLEKQREIYNNLISNLNKLEITGLVSANDVASIFQRIEIILRISEIMKRNIIELGAEGSLVKIRLKELVKGVEKDRKLISKDYSNGKESKYQKEISKLSFDTLLETSKISEIIFSNNEEYIKPKGYRLFDKIKFPKEDLTIIIEKFIDINEILNLSVRDIEKIIKNKELAENFIKEISMLKENIMMEKNL